MKIELANIGRPVTILAASSCKWSSLLEFPTPQLSHTLQAHKLCYFQIRIFQNSILHLMEDLVLQQILTNIWELHLAAMLNKEVSSAKSWLKEINFSAISLIYILNNRGPSTYPYGTQPETLQSEEDELFINTLCCRPCR
jgi:hypothetical protein